ncbi:MAG: PKD domain-containing protein [Parafilimonas sp.]
MKTNRTVGCSGLFILMFLFACNNSFSQLKADFSSNVQSGCTPLIVAFEDNSTGAPTNWSWTLGNGTIASNQNPVTTYFDAGSYTVKLTIKNTSGQDSLIKTSYITVYANPQIAFTTSATQGCFPLDVKFTNNSKAGSGTILNYLWDLGDGNIDTTVNVNHTYTSAGTFDITLKVTNSFGCYNALTKSDLIQISDGVNAGFSLTSLDICKTPATATFKNASNGSGTLIYNWDFGDGQKSSTASPLHNYTSSGSYNVLLTVQSSGGCSDTASMPVDVHIPVSGFSHTSATCLNQSIHFTNTSSPSPISSTWYFGDGTSSSELNPDKAFTKTGTYSVKLVNNFSTGCSDSVTNTVTIATGPTASFTADDTSKCSAPLTVNFKNTTTGAATGYMWDFGDGATSSSENPAHTYTQQGNFNVILTATNSNGCQAVFEKQKYIVIQPVKITGLKNLPDSGCVPLIEKPSVVLNSNYTIKSYSWNFGDGATSTDALPTHTYTKDGFFNIKVSVVTEDGCTDSFTLKNAVLAGHKPVASFTTKKDSICASELGEFVNTSTNGPITFLSWDGNILSDSAAGEFYSKNPVDTGYRPVTLVAYNYGCPDTLKKDSAIYVMPPIANMKFTTNCDDKQSVDFGDNSIEDAKRTWNFGDGQTDTTKNPTHVYSVPNNYTVTLYTTNKTCHDTISQNVRVINEVGTISLTDTVYCRGNNINADINGINTDNIKNTKWDFGDGTIITVNGATKANHAYIVNGKFKVRATMTDKNNCQAVYETKDSITVYGPLASLLTATPGACENSSVVFIDRSSSDGIHNIVKWSWNFGDTTNYNYSIPTTYSHTYHDTGKYSIRLSVTDSYGCTDTVIRYKYVSITHPYAAYVISDSIACPGKQVSFQNTSTGDNLNYLWMYGDGSQSNLQNPSHTYKISGTFNPGLLVTDVNGCKDSFNLPKLIVSAPVAKFIMSDSVSTCPPLEVNFTNQSTNYASASWSFGDGSPSVIVSPIHIYTYPGIYPVKLIVNGYGSCADTAVIKNITIKGPTGTMNYKATPVCYPDSTQFSASAKNTVVYTWDFSDGNTVSITENKIAYTYQPGHYLPKLILQDAAGCKVSIKGDDTIKIYDVKANANLVGNPACSLSPVQFNDISTSEDAIIHHYWYFGDNNLTDARSVTHAYQSPGNYNAYLIAETRIGCLDTFYIPAGVQVLPKPQIAITGDSSLCSNSVAEFKGKTSTNDSTIQWSWNFGDGNTSTGQNVSNTYNNSGNYNMNLVGINSGGCSDTTKKQIVVNASPKINAGEDTVVCQNSDYVLNASGAQTYTWAGTGLSCNNCSSPTIQPTVLSTYTVTGKNIFGCSASDSVNINVIKPDKISVFGDDTLCIGETAQLYAAGAETYQWFPSAYLDNSTSARPVFTATTDTAITYKVIGYTAKNCFADTGYLFVKTFPKPQVNIAQDEIVLNIGSSVRLNVSSSADVTTWRWSPPQGLSSTVEADPVASPIQTTTYSCIASNGGSCVSRDQITIRVVCGSTNVFIPNTFSPNKDGMNDVFFPRGKGLFNIKSFRVFNRWGQIVFERFNTVPNNANDGWNGSFNGKPLPSDVYVYIMEVECENNIIIPFKGNVTLVR